MQRLEELSIEADATTARVALFNAGAVLELLINLFEQQLGEYGKQNLAELEGNLGLRRHTLVMSLNAIQSDLDRAQRVVEVLEVQHG